MRKLIIVEGPDASGKTTLAKFIARKHNGLYVHMSGHKEYHPIMTTYHRDWLDNIEWNVKSTGSLVVLDRTWLSELIYGSIFRPNAPLFPFQEFQERIMLMGGLYIICAGNSDLHEANKNKDHPYSREDYIKICSGYKKWFQERLLEGNQDVINYFITHDGANIDQYCELLKIYDNERSIH
jgi:hypothetical protein